MFGVLGVVSREAASSFVSLGALIFFLGGRIFVYFQGFWHNIQTREILGGLVRWMDEWMDIYE
jgi:hypothetical protein